MYNETITFYSKTPPNKYKMEQFDIEYGENHRSCGDDLRVYMCIKDNKIESWSFEGDTSIITTACASVFGESILGKQIDDIFDLDYNYIQSLINMPISKRRKEASVLGVLTTRNALHTYISDGILDSFDDLIN